MVYLGLDLGSKTIGVSVSDRLNIIASSLGTIRYNSYDEAFDELEKIIIEKKVSKIVLGNPLNLDGSISKRSEITFEFKKLLENKFNIEVIMQDERLSTIEAENMLISNNTSRKKRKKVIDSVASVIILQSYLDRSNNGAK